MPDDFALQRARCLDLLRRRGKVGATTAELSDPAVGGHEGTRRVRELRQAGHPITCRPEGHGGGYWRYFYGEGPQEPCLWDEWPDDDDATTLHL